MLHAIATLASIVVAAASGHGLGATGTGLAVTAAHSEYGRVLFSEPRRRALYLFTRDRGASACYGECAKAWPPALTSGPPASGRGLDAGRLGTITRRDGSRQLAYNGHPLYYYGGDRRPGQILCQDVEEFGGRWYVVAPTGNAVT